MAKTSQTMETTNRAGHMSSWQGVIVFILTEQHLVSILANPSLFARDQISKKIRSNICI